MKNEFTVDSVLTEVKKSLTKYESLIKECESNPSKKKISEAESSKKKIEQKIKMVKTIIKTEDDNFMLESYEDLKNELNKRLNIVSKKYDEKKEKNNELFSSSHKKGKNSKKLKEKDEEDEDTNYNHSIKLSTDESSHSLDDEFAKSELQLNESSSGFIAKLCKEKFCMILIIIIVCIIGFYVIFSKKNTNDNS